MGMNLEGRRGLCVDITRDSASPTRAMNGEERKALESFDLIYRTLCALMFNFVPTSGHPGGSVSSGRMVTGLLFDVMDYDLFSPDREDADIISYAAGHKALGLYALWALRDEMALLGAPELLPQDMSQRLRLEDLLGFRRNPTQDTPLFTRFNVRPLDGHPTPATPFVRLSTGASGVGLASSLGLALGARDTFGPDAPRVHIVEGEGGLTPGRVAEALAFAGTAGLDNAILHVDWNQASIDSNRVCRDGNAPGDYVQWTPAELAYLHDWNVIQVPDGTDLGQVAAAQRRALALDNGQPTAVIYRTTKGWRYGIEGRVSHGAGHKLCSNGFHQAARPLLEHFGGELPACDGDEQRCRGGALPEIMEECFWDALQLVRRSIAAAPEMVELLCGRLRRARRRLDERNLEPRTGAPQGGMVLQTARQCLESKGNGDRPQPGSRGTLRGELGRVLNVYNRASGGAVMAAAADLLGSTSVNLAAEGFPTGYYHATTNPGARLLSVGGICEDAMAGILAGLSTYGHHLGVGSSYGAFLAALGHVPARLHAIGGQARQARTGQAFSPFVLVCAHAGLKTGEDGPTHADPQPLQLLQGNFPGGTMITLTPWEPQEVEPLMAAALQQSPSIIAPFVTRPDEPILDREALGLAPAAAATRGMYRLRAARGQRQGTVVLQGSGVTYAFVQDALPRLLAEGIELDVYYVASVELFDALPAAEQERIFPEEAAREAVGITGFTLPTLDRWLLSSAGRKASLHPYRGGRYPGSGQAEKVMLEAGLDGASQYQALRAWVGREKVAEVTRG
jgi:transketolase